jgi:hypothetical protein
MLEQANIEVVSFGPMVGSAVVRKDGCTARFDLRDLTSRYYKGEWPLYLHTGRAVAGCPNQLDQLFDQPKQ